MKAVDESLLEGRDDETLAEWWCLLNRWGWPEEIPNPEGREVFDTDSRRGGYMGIISEKIGHEKCNRHWNKDKMGDDEHAAWYRKTFRNGRV